MPRVYNADGTYSVDAATDQADGRAKRDKYEHLRTRARASRRRPRSNGLVDSVFVPFWGNGGEDADAWDTVQINGRTFAGDAEITNASVGRKVDTQSPPGADGARTIDKGYKPAEFDITLVVWTEEQLDDLSQLIPEIHPRRHRARGESSAIDVYHPAIALLQISRATVLEIGALEPASEPGFKQCKIKCQEFAPITPAPSSAVTTRRNGLDDLSTALPETSNDANAAPTPSTTNTGP